MARRKIRVNGIELHYIERGAGEALILVHGGLGDYRSWEPQLSAFSRRFRVFSYSRRYSYPNENAPLLHGHSVFAEAEDLAALVSQLQLGRAHLVGHSYGALIALVLALKRPQTVCSLILAEPPVHRSLEDMPGGKALLDEIASSVWKPVRKALAAGDTASAIRIFTDGINGPGYFDSLTDDERATRLANGQALQALMQSAGAFPAITREEMRRLGMPTLIVEGQNTISIHQADDEELLRCISASERVIIPDAGHGAPRDNPEAFNEAVLEFLRRHE